MICVLELGRKASLIVCAGDHTSLPSSDTIPPTEYISKYYSIKGMEDAGWNYTSNGWLCPDCSKFKRTQKGKAR